MTLQNLIRIADENLTMALYGTRGSRKYRFNFVNKAWDPLTPLNPEKIITVKEFKKSKIYQYHKKSDMIGWCILDANRIEGLKETNEELKIAKGIILSISIKVV